MQIENLESGLYRVLVDNTPHLGLKIGSRAGKSASRIAALVHEPGILFGAGTEQLGQWPIIGVVMHQEELIMYGPWLDGAVGFSAIEHMPRSVGCQVVIELVNAFLNLQSKQAAPDIGLFLSATAYLGKGNFLVMPESIQKAMLSLTTAPERIPAYDVFHRAGKLGIPNLIFGLDILFFRVMTGSLPYPDAGQPGLFAGWQLSGAVKTPRCLLATVPLPIESYYREHMQKGRLDEGSLQETLEVYLAWQATSAEHGNSHGVDPDAINSFAKRHSVFQRRQFLKKHAMALTAAAIGALVLAIVCSTVIGNLVKPPLTAGMDAKQVVEAYYGSLNTLDGELMKDTVRDKVGQDLVSMAENLYVISQIRVGTERRTVRVMANEWFKAGQPPVAADMMLFGAVGIDIKPIERPQPTGTLFLVDYELCTSSTEGYENPSPGYIPHLVVSLQRRQEEVTVLPIGKQGAWIITSIKRLRQDEPRSITVPVPAAQSATGKGQ